jgi:GT2 family glycosyltransferase
MAKPLALILLNWNTPKLTANCISTVMKYCNAELYDIIIVDNGSTDGSLSLLQTQFPQHIYIDNKENLGFAEGNNRALNYSIENDYTYSLLLNTDTEVDEDFLSPLIEYLEQHKKIAAVQPAIYFLDKKNQLWNGGSFFNQFFGITYSKNKKSRQSLQKPEKVEWLTGCCFLVKNEALKQTGLLNTKFFLYYEDVDLSFRLRENDYELHYYPNTKVYHEAGASGKQKIKNSEGTLSPIIHYYLCRNKIWFLRKYGNPAFALIMFIKESVYNTALFTYFIIRGRNKKAKYLYKGIKEGLFTPKSSIWL